MRCYATVRSTGQRCRRTTDGDSLTCSVHEHVGVRQTDLMDVLAAAVDEAKNRRTRIAP